MNIIDKISLLLFFVFICNCSSDLFSQTIEIPREGFPFCEPFTSTLGNTRAETVLGGSSSLTNFPAGNGALQLTRAVGDQTGYAFIDIPFSPKYGIKVSFEYFSYGSTSSIGADGMIFFMFDGKFGGPTSPLPFSPGGIGGSLSYSPRELPANPGMSGGYIAVSLDEYGNFAYSAEGKGTGIDTSPTNTLLAPPKPIISPILHSILVRGPESAVPAGYPYLEELHKYTNDICGICVTPGLQFTIDSPYAQRVESCLDDGYRKVFIDLKPDGTNKYKLSMYVLVNTGTGPTIVPIFVDVSYPYEAFSDLKIGFAASTGAANNIHEIKNVVVEVSEISAATLPQTEDKDFQLCVVETGLEIKFPIVLPDEDAFIRCLQLYQVGEPIPSNNNSNSSIPSPADCGFGNSACDGLCNPINFEKQVSGGTFKADLQPLFDSNIDLIGNEVQIQFVPDPGFVGTAEIIYTVTDNFGLTSEPKKITVQVLPQPILESEDIVFPTCDLQQDGSIFLVVGELYDNFEFNWVYTSPGGVQTDLGTAGTVIDLGGNRRSFFLDNLNLGTYKLIVDNPSDALGCPVEVAEIFLDKERGTPVDIEVNDQIICEGQDVTFNPLIDASFGSDSGAEFFWYVDSLRTGNQIVNGSTRIIDGQPVSFEIINEREIIISDLVADGINFKDYVFYVEAKSKSNPSGNFCPFLGNVITEARVRVYPKLDFSATKTADDWCLDNSGNIIAQVNDPISAITYSLVNSDNGTVLLTNGSGNFFGLAKGNYEVFASSSSPVCTSVSVLIVIEGPDQQLTLTPGPTENAFCNSPTGEMQFNLSGGNLPYKSITIDGSPISNPAISGDIYTLSDLSAGTYTIVITDDKDCQESVQITISGDQASVFATTNDEICEGESATVSPQIVTQSSSTPIFTWYYLDGGNYIEITNGASAGGATFTIDGSNNLSVSGLAPQGTPYVYFLEVTGPKVCDQGYIPAEIRVNPTPKPSDPILEMVSCNGGSDGSIQIQLSEGNLSDFQYALKGNNGVNIGFTSNSGLFSGLAAGIYELSIRSSSGCETILTGITITEPPVLSLAITSKTDATCSEENGQLSFTVGGGTLDASGNYQIDINGADISTLGSNVTVVSSNNYTITNLAPGNYLVEIEDANGCLITSTETILDTEVPVFTVQDIDVCEGETAILTPEIVSNTIGASPVYTWSFENPSSPGQFVPIQNGDVINGATYSLTNGVLSVTGLVSSNISYKYYLNVSGDLVCPGPPIEAEIQVLIVPKAVFQEVNVSCFNGNDGEIQLVSVDPSGSNTFTIIETGQSNSTGSFTGLIAGSYTVRIQKTGSPCFSDFPFTITQPNELIINNPQGTNPTCGESNGSIQFDVTGGSPDYAILVNGNPLTGYSASINGQTVELRNLPPGTYSVAVTDANDCEVTSPDLLTLVNDDGIDVNMNPLDEVVCVGGDAVLLPTYSTALSVAPSLKWYKDAALTQSIANGTDAAGVIYQVNPTSGELTIQGLQIGDFTYYVEISGQGICSKIESATVEVYPEITATIDVQNIICFGDTNGSIQITPSGGNGNFETSLNGAPFTVSTSYMNLAAGDYTVSIRNDLGCLTEIDVEILGPSEAISINDPTIIRASCDLDNGSISDLVISGGWGGFAVEWRKGSVTGPVVTGGLTGVADLSPDTYFLIVSDSQGCSEEFSFIIEQSSDPVYAVVPPINSCTGNSVQIRPVHIAPDPSLPPAAATEVRWYSGPGQTGLIQNGPDSAIPGVTYTIDDSDWLNPQLLIDGLPAGTYKYYFYVVCTGQELEIEVIAYDTPEIDLETDNVNCFGDTNGKVEIVNGAIPTYTYSVNGAAPVDLATLESQTFATGTYDLLVATPAGCSQELTFIIEGPSAPLASSPLTKLDPGCGALNGKLILTVTGGWTPYTLEVFKNGSSDRIVTSSDSNITLDGFAIGVYKIEIRDAEGCQITTNEVTLIDGPTQVLVTNDVICEGEVATLTPSLDPVSNGSTFQWFYDQALTQPISSSPNPATDGKVYQIDSSTGVLTISGLAQAVAPYNYFVTASGGTICPGFIGEGNVTVGGTPTATAVVVDEICFGDGGSITVNASGGSGNYTYSLNGGTFGTSNVFEVAAGDYSIEVRTQEGCSFTLDNVLVNGPTSPLAVTSLEQDDASCGLDNGEIRFTVEGGYTPYSVSYSKNGSVSGTSSSADGDVKISDLGLGSYSFTIIDGQGCEFILDSPITITKVPTTITANDDTICEGETAELIASVPQNIPDPQFTWTFDAQGNNPITSGEVYGIRYAVGQDGQLDITGLRASGSPFTYYVSATGTGICGLSPKPVTVTISSVANLRVSNPSVVCDPNGRVDLTDYIEGFNPSVYDYNVLSPSGAAMQINEIENVALSGDYRVSSSVKGTNCWNQPQRIRVLIAETKLVANFQYEIDLGGGNMITNGDIQIEEDVQFLDLTSGNAIIWNWDFGDGNSSTERNPVHQFQTKGAYIVVLTTIDEIGCQSEFQILVNVFDDYIVMIPNAFTPGGAKNQYFKPQFRGIASMEFFIFNTWGELIYHAKSLEDLGWDGTLNGVTVPNGNYVYRGRFVSRSGEKIDKSGVFILIR